MKTKTKHGRYHPFVLLLAFSIIVGIGASNSMMAFADHPKIDVSIAPGSNIPGCETTDECYIPHEVTVDAGGEVIWTNDGTSATTITSGNPADGPDDLFDSGLVDPGSSFSFKFEEHGEYRYFSMIHPWMAGIVTVQEAGSEEETHDEGEENGHGEGEKDPRSMKEEEEEGEMMKMKMEGTDMPAGDASATGMLSDGTMVSIWTSEPTAGERMEISIEFADAEHVNHNIMVAQNGQEVLNDEGAHHHDGKGMHTTAPLGSSDPVDVTVTFQGYGVDDPKTGPIGEEVVFSNVVPEFGTIAMMILAVAIISIVAASAKSRLSLMPRL
ncbi:PEFG-CTERM sorting domain-containing protein [Nitrosopumilus sp.]|uniref:PEFG-CTERM sorting domain-containing protein n=1 Tax=Nitrosopumilus sp. TaxID=2024843 RepID=UPI00292EFC27|nr:PEFG-CTERM sorting domain-containing protein [Nitrosopumilus sp.]